MGKTVSKKILKINILFFIIFGLLLSISNFFFAPNKNLSAQEEITFNCINRDLQTGENKAEIRIGETVDKTITLSEEITQNNTAVSGAVSQLAGAVEGLKAAVSQCGAPHCLATDCAEACDYSQISAAVSQITESYDRIKQGKEKFPKFDEERGKVFGMLNVCRLKLDKCVILPGERLAMLKGEKGIKQLLECDQAKRIDPTLERVEFTDVFGEKRKGCYVNNYFCCQ